MLGHLFFEHLFEDRLHALADPSLHVSLHLLLELMLRGQVRLLRAQPTTYQTLSDNALVREQPYAPVPYRYAGVCRLGFREWRLPETGFPRMSPLRLSGKYLNGSDRAFLGSAERRKLRHFAPSCGLLGPRNGARSEFPDSLSRQPALWRPCYSMFENVPFGA